jgi:hypothetical protein
MTRQNVFLFLWSATTIAFIWLLRQGHQSFDSEATIYVLAALLACTIALLFLFPVPSLDIPSSAPAAIRIWSVFAIVLAVIVLFLARIAVGSTLLFAWPFLAVGVLIYLKPAIDRRAVIYAVFLAFVAGLTGLGALWIPMSPAFWALLQVFLVVTGLLAGWALLRHTGLWQAGIGHSQFMDRSISPALIQFGLGILIAIPWSLGLVLIGGAESETWVENWWQSLIALSPGIAEEVWGRIFPIPMFFWLLSRVERSRRAYILALLILNYWFAYLHTSGGLDALFSTVMIGTLYGLPLSFICMHRDLETAIGFHFFVDFAKFSAAFLLGKGI